MRFFRKKEEVVVERRRRVSSRMTAWFRSQGSFDSRPNSDVNGTDSNGTRLHVACIEGCLPTVKKLLQKGVDVNYRTLNSGTEAGYTSLHYAVKEGSSEIVKFLLMNNALVNSESDCGVTPLHIAAQIGNVPIAETLLKHGASIYSECTSLESDNFIPLHYALKERHLGVVKLLLVYGAEKANSEILKKYNKTTYRLAQSSQDYTIIAYLFMSHIGLKKKNKIISLEPIGLKKKNKNISLLDPVSQSEVEYANVAQHVSKWIFSTSNIINSALLLPALLHSAVEIGYVNIVKDFLQRGVDIHTLYHPLHAKISDETFGYTLLHTATKCGHLDIVKMLISHGGDVNAKDKNQKTPIFFAIEKLNVNMTKLLLSNGAIIDPEN